MRYTQDSGVKRHDRSPACEEYRVVVSVYLTPEERDMWGAGQVKLALRIAEPAPDDRRYGAQAEREFQRCMENAQDR